MNLCRGLHDKRLRKPKGQSRMDNLEALSTMGTQDTGHINVRENRRVNQEWTNQREWQHWSHKTQDEDKQNTNSDPTKTRGLIHVLGNDKQCLPLNSANCQY
jgi:CRISPR/Cas system-associated endonuclease/helicase Cas3